MKPLLWVVLAMILLVAMVACGENEGGDLQTATPDGEAPSVTEADSQGEIATPDDAGPASGRSQGRGMGPGQGMGRGMGPGSGMMARHHATVPDAYAGQTNPLEPTEEVLAAGEELYTTYCATCHGDGGMGDGPAGVSLDPPPSPIAHTSQMLGDDYLFWRVSEGGNMAPFNSAMPAWKGPLTAEQRWQVSTYVRALGSGNVIPGRMMNGALYDPEVEAAQRAAMLAEAVERGLITQVEADVFGDVHAAMDGLMAAGMPRAAGGMSAMQQALLTQLVNDGTITAEQAAIFDDVHERLLAADMMQ